MFDYLFDPAFLPFSFALALLFGLAGLELAALLIGASFLGNGEADADLGGIDGLDGPDAPDLGDIGGDLSLDTDGLSDFGDLGDLDLADIDGMDLAEGATLVDASGGVGSWLGLGKMPMLIWLAAFLLGFGLSGVGLQLGVKSLIGSALSPWLIGAPAGVFGIWFARSFGSVFARLLPQVETEALSERSLGRRRGVITQGTAAKGRPAEVRVMDRYGNAHYLRAEPFAQGEEITQGTDVLVIRDRRQDAYVLIPLSE
ncbi:OB-fold-containig protein [Pseudophaeobacter sp.]|uniref:OB-fold-containig protein n=1 Tax=Pseudophaeobacter sp. TaxID=1971739 RepID=UPI00329843F0